MSRGLEHGSIAVGTPTADGARTGLAGFLFHSVKGQLLGAFLAVSACTAGIGIYALGAIDEVGELVARSYDRSLLVVSYARAAATGFAAMDRALGRSQLDADPAVRKQHLDEIERIHETLSDGLHVVRSRALSDHAAVLAQELEAEVDRWDAVRRKAGTEPLRSDEWSDLDELAGAIADKFDNLIEVAATDGFAVRQTAIHTIERSRLFNTISVIAGVVVALAVPLLFVRRILRPLGAAVAAAERVARGDLTSEIPEGGRDETGVLLRSMATMQRNLKEMMEREVGLRRAVELRLGDALEGTSEAVVLVDVDDRIQVANNRLAEFFPPLADRLEPGRIFGEAVQAAKRLKLFDAEAGSDVPMLYSAARIAGSASGEVKLSDGRWLRVSFSRTRDQGTVVIWSDITGLIEREERLALAKELAETANRAKSRFLAAISHELRTPLNAIIGFSEIISGEVLGPISQPKYKHYASDILSSGQHLLEIINDILDLSKSEAGTLDINPELLELESVIEACERTIMPQCATAKVAFSIEVAPDLPPVNGDAVRLRQVLLNLLSNAAKFTPEGGSVSLTARADPASGEVLLAVADTGIGMRPEDIPLALEPFGQIDSSLARKYEGTGLGLPLTKLLVEKHGGMLEIVSAPGQGTTVTVRLPAAEAVSASAERSASAANAA